MTLCLFCDKNFIKIWTHKNNCKVKAIFEALKGDILVGWEAKNRIFLNRIAKLMSYKRKQEEARQLHVCQKHRPIHLRKSTVEAEMLNSLSDFQYKNENTTMRIKRGIEFRKNLKVDDSMKPVKFKNNTVAPFREFVIPKRPKGMGYFFIDFFPRMEYSKFTKEKIEYWEEVVGIHVKYVSQKLKLTHDEKKAANGLIPL
jgi:hypothetical protein